VLQRAGRRAVGRVLRVDLEPLRQRGRASVELRVEPVAPSTNYLRHWQARRRGGQHREDRELVTARAVKDFAKADALRLELQALGYLVETTKSGTTLRPGAGNL